MMRASKHGSSKGSLTTLVARVFTVLLAFAMIAGNAGNVGRFLTQPLTAYAQQGTVEQTISDFESNDEGWIFHNGPEYPGATGGLVAETNDSYEGTKSGKLTGDFSGGGNYVSMYMDLADVDMQELRFWIKTEDLAWLALRLTDSTGQIHQQEIDITPGPNWQEIVITDLAGGNEPGTYHWGGAEDGLWHGPAIRVGLNLEYGAFVNTPTTGTLLVDKVTATVPDGPAGPYYDDEIISDYEGNDVGWAFHNGPEFPGATGTLTRDTNEHHTGAAAGKLTGDFTNGGVYVSMNKELPDIDMEELSFWVKTQDLNAIALRLFDETGQIHQQRIEIQPNGNWQQIVVTHLAGLPGPGTYHWGGAEDGLWHGPAIRMDVLMEESELVGTQTSGTLWIDDVSAHVPRPTIRIKQDHLGNSFGTAETIAFQVDLAQDADLVWSATDFWGRRVAGSGTQTIDGTAQLQLPQLGSGYYRLKVEASSAGQPVGTAETTFSVLSPVDLSQTNASSFGVATHFAHGWNPDMIPLIENAGAKNFRDEMYWSRMEPSAGVYETPEDYTEYYETAVENNLEPLMILSFNNANHDGGATPYTNAGRQAFADYGNALLSDFPATKWVEVYNEFNIMGDFGDGPADNLPSYYYELLKTSYQTIKAANPNTIVIGGVVAHNDWSWMEELFQLGGLQYMDILSVHPYNYPASPEGMEAELKQLDTLVKQYNNGQSKPIWGTETGWPTQLDARGISESSQASYVVRANVTQLAAGVEKVYWYDFMNDGIDPIINEQNFGLIRNARDALGKYAPKPGYAAYGVMTRQLEGKPYDHKETVAADIYSYIFGSGSGQQRVLWSSTPKQVAIQTSSPIVITDVMGGTTTLNPHNGYAYLTVTGAPVYMNASSSTVIANNRFTLTGGEAVKGEAAVLTLSVDNTASGSQAISGTVEVQGTSVAINVGAGQQQQYQISVPALSNDQTLFGIVKAGGQAIAKLSADVRLVDPIVFSAKHVLTGSGDAIRMAVVNRSSQPYTLDEVDWQVGTQTGTLNAGLTVAAHSSGSIDLPVTGLTAGTPYATTLSFLANGSIAYVYEGKLIGRNPSAMKDMKNRTVTVDGTADANPGTRTANLATDGNNLIQNYGGSSDLNGDIWLNWDQNNVYITAKIQDNVFSQTSQAGSIWQGDSLQFSIAQGTPGESGLWHEFGAALTPQGPELFRWLGTEGYTSGPVSNGNVAITRNETTKTTFYEIALPWTELAPAASGDGMLSVSLLVNDNDGSGRKGYIEWGSGIGDEKDSALFRSLKLVP